MTERFLRTFSQPRHSSSGGRAPISAISGEKALGSSRVVRGSTEAADEAAISEEGFSVFSFFLFLGRRPRGHSEGKKGRQGMDGWMDTKIIQDGGKSKSILTGEVVSILHV